MDHERRIRTFTPLVFDTQAFCCDEAERFSAWTDTLISRLTKDGTSEPTTEQLYEAKAKLVDEYRKERNGVLKAHRDRLSDKAGDPCIHGVFIATLDRLADIRAQPKITPPPRRRPVAPPPDPEPKLRPTSVFDAIAEAFKDR